jgi:hypothetical protein
MVEGKEIMAAKIIRDGSADRLALLNKVVEEAKRQGVVMTGKKHGGYYNCVNQQTGRETRMLVYTMIDGGVRDNNPGSLYSILSVRHEKINKPDINYCFVLPGVAGAADRFFIGSSADVAQSITVEHAEYNAKRGVLPEDDKNDMRKYWLDDGGKPEYSSAHMYENKWDLLR